MVEEQNHKSSMEDYLSFCQYYHICFVFSVGI